MDGSLGHGFAVLDTPALLVVMEVNIARIAGVCSAAGVHWRPHIKGNETPEIALRQIAAGAIGVTCAKLGEAQEMADAGISDILVANQIVGSEKIRRSVKRQIRSLPSTTLRT
jgi:D-serine deaminase-like pyridoxal phosphate-dependent protein